MTPEPPNEARAQALRDVAAMLRTQADQLERCGLRPVRGGSHSGSADFAMGAILTLMLMALAGVVCWWMTGLG